MQKKPDLGREPVGKLLFQLALPNIVAQLVNLLYNLVDRIFIARIPGVGTEALTGVGVCMPLIMIISAFASLAAMGGAPQASIALGQGDREKAEKILGSCAALLTALAAVLTAVMVFFHRPLLLAFGANEATIDHAASYMAIYGLGTVFVQGALGLNAFITAQGFSKISMMTVLIGALLNTALDPLFIFAFGMGVQGAALATVMAQAASCFFVVRFLTGPRTGLKLRRSTLRLNWKLLAPCVALGLSPFVMQSTESLISICFNTSLQAYGGTHAVGTMTLCSSIMSLSLLPLQGLSQGAQPIVSYNYGAGNTSRVKKGFRLLMTCCLSYSVIFGLLAVIFPQFFVSIFTPDAALREYAAPLVRVYIIGTVLFGAQIACQQTFVAIGNAKCSLFLACLRKLILLIPLVYILPNFFEDKVFAVFLAEPIADIGAVMTTVTLFSIVFTKTMKQIEQRKGNV